MIRALIVDDHASVRMGLRVLLQSAGGIRVVGEADDKEQAVRLVKERGPDVVILDLRLAGGTDGLEVCRGVGALPRPPRVLVHTAFDDAEGITRSALAGADGYVSKASEPGELVEGVRRVHAGERVWLADPWRASGAPGPERDRENRLLTPKEREVYALKLGRYPNIQIARKLFISERTVKAHVSSIMRKLEKKGRGSLN